MTGHNSDGLREQAHDLDVFCVLEKPVPGHIFLRAVREVSEHGGQAGRVDE